MNSTSRQRHRSRFRQGSGNGQGEQGRHHRSTNLSGRGSRARGQGSEKVAAENKKRKEIIEARNQADQIVYATEKTLGELGDKISDQNKANVQAEIENVKKVKDGDSKDAINAAVQKLAQVSQSVFGEIYGQQAGQQPGADS